MRKRLLGLALVFCMVPGISSAQQGGEWWIGGSLGVDYTKVKDGGGGLFNASVTPEFGYAFSDRWALGGSVGYIHDEVRIGGVKVKADGFTVNPFARYSVWRNKNFNFFLDGGVGYTYLDGDVETNRFDVGIRPGIQLQVSPRVSIMGKIGFIGYEYDKTGDVKTNNFSANFEMDAMQFGMIYRF